MRLESGSPPSIAGDYPFIYNEDNLGNIMIVKDGDRVVATVAIWTNDIQVGLARLKVGGINCVATRSGYRGRGLATLVMRAAHQRLGELRCQVGRLTTNISKWYRRLGWEFAGSKCYFDFNHSNVDLLPQLPIDVMIECTPCPFEDETLQALLELHHGDRLGGVRTVALTRTLFKSGNSPRARADARIVMARRRDTAVAYLIDRGGTITEWGGKAEIVSGLLRAWFEQDVGRPALDRELDAQTRVAGSERMTMIAPRAGHPLINGLEPLSLPCRYEYWGMLYILDPRGTLDAFGLHDITVHESDGRFTLTRGRAQVTVNRPQLAKLLFGPERISDFAGDVLPVTFWQWPLEHV